MKKVVLIGVGVAAAAAGLGYYLYNKNRSSAAAALSPYQPSPSSGGSVAPGQISTPTTAVPAVKQTIWKDITGNTFELTGDKQRWGYVIKVNGSIQGKTNQMEVMVLGPDGYMVGADNNGSVFVYKNNGWQNVVRDNKSAAAEYLLKLGVTKYLNGLAGLGNAFILN